MTDKRRQPRDEQERIAKSTEKFWLPCPLCNELFGGHEWSANSSIMYCDGAGAGVCDNCTEEAHRINEINADWVRKIIFLNSPIVAEHDALIEEAIRRGREKLKGLKDEKNGG